MPGFHHAVAGALGGNGQPIKLAGEANGKIADVDHFMHLAKTLRGDLARFDGHEASEFGLMRPQFLAQQAHKLAASRGRHHPPGLEGFVSRVNGGCGLRL